MDGAGLVVMVAVPAALALVVRAVRVVPAGYAGVVERRGATSMVATDRRGRWSD